MKGSQSSTKRVFNLLAQRFILCLSTALIGSTLSGQTFFKDCITGTVKCTNCSAGDVGTAHGITYTAVDNATLASMAANHTIHDLSTVCTTLVTDMSSLFFFQTTFNQNISNWDVSNVTNMNQMFAYADAFNQDIGNWETHNVEDMLGMFFSADGFQGSYLQDWDVSSVTTMKNMFNSAVSFGENISSWDVSSVTDFNGMFNGASSFQADLSQWCVANVGAEPPGFATGTSMVSGLFPNWGTCPSCTDPAADNYQPLATSDNGSCYYFYLAEDGITIKCDNCQPFDKGEVDGSEYMAVGNSTFETLRFDLNTACTSYLDNICTTPVTDMKEVLMNRPIYSSIRKWDVSNVTNMYRMLASSSCIPDITHWDVSNVTNMQDMFNGTFCFNQDLGGWDVSNVTNMYGMFANSAINNDLSGWDVSSVTNMREMFRGANNFNQDIGNWDVSNVTLMDDMFQDALSFNQDLSGWCVEQVVGMNPEFPLSNFALGSPLIEANVPVWGSCGGSGCTDPTASNYNPGATTDDGSCYYFYLDTNGITVKCTGCEAGDIGEVNGFLYQAVDDTSLPEILADGSWPLSHVCTSLVTVTADLFQNQATFNEDISSWDMSGVFNMERMFDGASSFNQNINNWDVSGVFYFSDLFRGATAFNQPLNQWDVSNAVMAAGMFNGATSFNQPIGAWNFNYLTNASYMFYQASSFNQDISNWNMSTVQYMQYMFEGAPVFNQPLNSWDVSNVQNMGSMFALTEAFNQPLDNWDVSSVTSVTYMFYLATAFNQDISGWCVPEIPPQDILFALNAPLLPEYFPQWGTCPNGCLDCFEVTFRLDLNEAPTEIVAPEVNGSFNDWCGDCNPLEDADGDGIWETTLLVPGGQQLWKYSSNNLEFEETLDPETMGACLLGDSFGNEYRVLTLAADTILPAFCWESCTLCPSAPNNTHVEAWVCPGDQYILPNGELLSNLYADTIAYTPNADGSLTITSIGIEEVLTLDHAYDCENDALLVTISDLGTHQGVPDMGWEFLANGQFYTVNATGTITVPGVTPDQSWRLYMFESNNCAPDYFVFPDCVEPPCENATERIINGNFDDLASNDWVESSFQLDGSTPTGYGVIDPAWTFDESAQAAWLGGFSNGSLTSISQDIFLPLTTETTVLQWWQWHAGSCQATDVLSISLNDTEIFNLNGADDPNCNAANPWRLMEVDISAFTTGETYTLTFEYAQTGAEGWNSCFIDNVSIQTCPCLPDITEETVQVCQWDSYTFPDGTTVDNINAPFTQYSYSSPPPCVVGIATTVEVLPVPVAFVADTVCHGEVYTYADGTSEVITSAPTGAYQTFLTAASGCDSVVYEQPIYIPENFTSEEITLCAGSDFTFPDGSQVFSILNDATYLSTLVAASGCDSLIETTLIVLPACTDPLACNYSPSASCADNSTCQYTSNAVVDMTAHLWTLYYDTDCDGEDGSIEMEFFADQTWFSPSSVPGNWSLCGTTYTNTFSGYDGIYQATWNGVGFEGTLLNDPSNLEQCIWLYPIGPGCMDPVATNYNPAATSDDGSCITPGGCTDPEACNYDPFALVDDGSCAIVPGDLNNDCEVGTIDMLTVIGDFNCSEPVCPVPEGESPLCVGDVNNDCSVSASDILYVLGLFGTGI